MSVPTILMTVPEERFSRYSNSDIPRVVEGDGILKFEYTFHDLFSAYRAFFCQEEECLTPSLEIQQTCYRHS